VGGEGDIQSTAPDIDLGGPLTLSNYIWNFNALWAEALGHANLPAMSDKRAGRWELG
jgi:hypothetical protein